MARYQTLDNQAPVQSELDNSDLKIGRSAFDFSHVHSGNAIIGSLIPVLNMEVVPNEDIDINLAALIELRNPLTRPLLNGMRVYFHGYINYLVDLWEGAKNFLDTGRAGTISLQRPNLVYSFSTSLGMAVTAATPLSLLDYLGLPPQYCNFVDRPPLRSFQFLTSFARNIPLSSAPDFFPADCCVAYQRNWRDFYSNKNLLQNNKFWFPDNEDHFILSYECTEAVALYYGNESFSDETFGVDTNLTGPSVSDNVTPEPNNPSTVPPEGGFTPAFAPNLSGIKFRQFKGDRFTSSLPFPDLIRGAVPVLSQFLLTSRGSNPDVLSSHDSTASDPTNDTNHDIGRASLNSIRALETFTVFKERMARTSGDYNDMIEAQFGYNPHHHTHEGTYIGGFYMDFSMSTVVQTSQSTEQSPLGQKAGQAGSSGTGRIGHVKTRDYGWIQVYMSIVPDVMYTQGLARQYDKKNQLDMYFPIFNNLAPQAIKNKELYISGDTSTDNDVFAYEDRYAEFKSCPNRVSGLMALPHSVAEYDASRIMARRFTSTPALNSQFVTLIPENVDMQVFSVQDEPPFDFQVGFNIDRVFPGPYTAIPGSMSSNLHA